MKYWLLKSEPNVWSFNQQKKVGSKGAIWDGVRNYQAENNLKKMKKGDLCFYYHSNIGKEIVGIVKVIKTAFIDPSDKKKKFVAVQVRFKKVLKNTVSLIDIKKNKWGDKTNNNYYRFNKPILNSKSAKNFDLPIDELNSYNSLTYIKLK